MRCGHNILDFHHHRCVDRLLLCVQAQRTHNFSECSAASELRNLQWHRQLHILAVRVGEEP